MVLPVGHPLPRWADELFGYRVGNPDADLSFDERDSAAYAPLAVVIDPAFTWGDDRPPRTPWHKTIFYELHVKGFTQLHPEVPERLRGRYLGLAREAAVRHLTSLGITAVELMPVHHFLNDRHLVDRELNNYWGYSTLAFFAPASRYTATRVPQDAVQRFKMMVSALHAADISTGEHAGLYPCMMFLLCVESRCDVTVRLTIGVRLRHYSGFHLGVGRPCMRSTGPPRDNPRLIPYSCAGTALGDSPQRATGCTPRLACAAHTWCSPRLALRSQMAPPLTPARDMGAGCCGGRSSG